MAYGGYAAWRRALKEQAQAEWLSESFWRMDGAGDAALVQVRTRSGLEAVRRALRATRAVNCGGEARRGRRAPVGEDVPGRNGSYPLGIGSDRSIPGWVQASA
ncbi:hypothetical protein ON010_g8123 [Phytophthora cinnamomi]|nr:hypothetical protein ON010_g8123 [Phytophthora cinnamomi]